MASITFQLEESKKPNPRYVLELNTIREMKQKADSMDRGLRELLGLPRQPTDVDYQVLLASIPPDSPAMTLEAISILERFSCTSGADLEAHRVPSHVVAFMEQHRDHLQHASSKSKLFTLRRTQLNSGVGLLSLPSATQSMSASGTFSMGPQITGVGSNGGAQSQPIPMSAPLTQDSADGVAPSPILTQSAGAVPLRWPKTEEVTPARRWVEEQKRIAFNHSS